MLLLAVYGCRESSLFTLEINAYFYIESVIFALVGLCKVIIYGIYGVVGEANYRQAEG
jgi:ABC-type antimicrobial peptide transport system permease subunit